MLLLLVLLNPGLLFLFGSFLFFSFSLFSFLRSMATAVATAIIIFQPMIRTQYGRICPFDPTNYAEWNQVRTEPSGFILDWCGKFPRGGKGGEWAPA